LGEGGVVPLDESFVTVAAELAAETGALLCVDEIQTGMGRTGTFLASEQLRVVPDLITLAKGLANGLPIGALLVRGSTAGGFVPGDHGSTFGGNPVVCAAACAVVDAIDDDLLANVRSRGDELAAGLAALPGVLEVRGRGLLLGATLDRPVAPVVDSCRDRGLLVLSAGPDVLRLTPPLVVGPAAGGLERSRAIASAMRRYAISVEATANILVVTTPSGYANALAQSIDENTHPGIAGTIAGDNTIFVAAREGTSAPALRDELA